MSDQPPSQRRPSSVSRRPSGEGARGGVNGTPARKHVVESKLVCVAGPKQGTEFPLVATAEEVVMGRAADCAVSVPDTSVSRRHAQLRHTPEGWRVSDLGSGNGTLVNGERLTEEIILRSGDRIMLGDSEFTFMDLTDTARRAAPSRRSSFTSSPPVRRPSISRPSIAGRPDVRARLSRVGGVSAVAAPAGLTARRLGALAGFLVVVVVAALAGAKLWKARQEAQVEAAQKKQQEAGAQLSTIFQDGKNLVREGRWTQAKAKFEELMKIRPSYPGLQEYLDRTLKEIPNEKNLGVAEAALAKADLAAAAASLAKVTTDTQQYERLAAAQRKLDEAVAAKVQEAQTAVLGRDFKKAKDLADEILRAQPNNRDAKLLADQASTGIGQAASAHSHSTESAPKPQEEGELKFIEGDLPGAIALEDECASRFTRCKSVAAQMREFGDQYKRVEEMDAKSLRRLLALDRDITEGRRSKLARNAGIKLGTALFKAAAAAKASGQYKSAGEQANQALQADPSNTAAASLLNELKSKAHEIFLKGYSLKDQDPDAAVEQFRIVTQMTAPGSEDYEKAQSWIGKLQR